MKVDLSKYDNSWYTCGRNYYLRSLWFLVNALILQNPLNPSSKIKVIFLRLFGAKIGSHVVIKPGVSIKYPWNLEISDYAWIGERVWFDSLGKIIIGSNVCLSQGTYLCTGNHNWADSAFGLIVKPILIEEGVWVGANATVLPGSKLASHTVITAGSVVSKDTEPYGIYEGNPAKMIKKRDVRSI